MYQISSETQTAKAMQTLILQLATTICVQEAVIDNLHNFFFAVWFRLPLKIIFDFKQLLVKQPVQVFVNWIVKLTPTDLRFDSLFFHFYSSFVRVRSNENTCFQMENTLEFFFTSYFHVHAFDDSFISIELSWVAQHCIERDRLEICYQKY